MLSKLMYKYAPHFDDLRQTFCLHKATQGFLWWGLIHQLCRSAKLVSLSLQGELFLMYLFQIQDVTGTSSKTIYS